MNGPLLGWLVGCVVPVFSQGELVQLEAFDVSTLGDYDVPADLLVGTTTCPMMDWGPLAPVPPPAAGLSGCFDILPVGVAALQNGCLTFTQPGPGGLHFEPTGCGLD